MMANPGTHNEAGEECPPFDIFEPIQEEAENISVDQERFDHFIDDEDDSLPQSGDIDWVERFQNVGLKDRFATHVIWITYGWMFMVICSVIATGICAIYGREFLSDAVLITLLSATSLSAVLGLFCIILRYLFNPRRQ